MGSSWINSCVPAAGAPVAWWIWASVRMALPWASRARKKVESLSVTSQPSQLSETTEKHKKKPCDMLIYEWPSGWVMVHDASWWLVSHARDTNNHWSPVPDRSLEPRSHLPAPPWIASPDPLRVVESLATPPRLLVHPPGARDVMTGELTSSGEKPNHTPTHVLPWLVKLA